MLVIFKTNLILFLGQKDKPFVGEEEHEQRTPRPDLLDKPFPIVYNEQQATRTNYKVYQKNIQQRQLFMVNEGFGEYS